MPSKPRAGITSEQRAVGERLQEALDRNELTHKQFGELVDKSLRTIEGYVAGEFSPKSIMKKAQQILGIPIDYLMTGNGPRIVASEPERMITYGEFAHWRKSVDVELERLRRMLIELEAKQNGSGKAQAREA
jgi:transcriptional regulator with XRE-family HTH domain